MGNVALGYTQCRSGWVRWQGGLEKGTGCYWEIGMLFTTHGHRMGGWVLVGECWSNGYRNMGRRYTLERGGHSKAGEVVAWYSPG